VVATDEIIDACKCITSMNFEESSMRVSSEVKRILRCDSATIYITDSDTHEVVGNPHDTGKSFRIPLGEGVAGIVASTGETLSILDAEADPRYVNKERDKKNGYRTIGLLCVPLIDTTNNNQIIGCIEAVNKLEGIFSKGDEESARLLGCLAGNALGNAKKFKEVDGFLSKARCALDLLRTLTTEMSSNSFANTVVQQANKVLDADRCVLFFMDNVHRALYQMHGTASMSVPPDKGFAGHVVTTGQFKNVVDAYEDSLFNSANDKKTGYRTRSVLCVPIRSVGTQVQVVGVLQFTNKLPMTVSSSASSLSQRFSEDDVYLATAFANLLYPIVSGSTMYQQIVKKGQRAVVGGASFKGAAAVAGVMEEEEDYDEGE